MTNRRTRTREATNDSGDLSPYAETENLAHLVTRPGSHYRQKSRIQQCGGGSGGGGKGDGNGKPAPNPPPNNPAETPKEKAEESTKPPKGKEKGPTPGID